MQDHFIYVSGFDEPFKIEERDREVVRKALTETGYGGIAHVNVRRDQGSFIHPVAMDRRAGRSNEGVGGTVPGCERHRPETCSTPVGSERDRP